MAASSAAGRPGLSLKAAFRPGGGGSKEGARPFILGGEYGPWSGGGGGHSNRGRSGHRSGHSPDLCPRGLPCGHRRRQRGEGPGSGRGGEETGNGGSGP